MPLEIGVLASLEVLDIYRCDKLVELPVSIEKMVKLRHLNLSYCSALTHLPYGIGALTSLEVLNISWCGKFKELPMGAVKLINLKCLDLEGCYALTHMPSGMGSLTSLCTLTNFIIGDPGSEHTPQFEELDRLSASIGGNLMIELPKNMVLIESRDGEAFLFNKKMLLGLEIKWQDSPEEEGRSNHMDILAKLQPSPNLLKFHLDAYLGKAFPPWLSNEGFASVLPNLKDICISECRNCKHLPSFSGLPHLRGLTLRGLSNLEYIEENISSAPFCPSLERLTLYDLPELKGWCTRLTTGADDDGEYKQSLLLPSFPCLLILEINYCPSLTVAPILVSFIKVFSIKSLVEREETLSSSMHSRMLRPLSSSSVSLCVQACSNGGGFCIYDYDGQSLLLNILGSPSIHMDESFREMSTHLETLIISSCSGLKTLQGVQHLTALTHLEIKQCPEFTGGEDSQVSWKELQRLKYLTLSELPKMVRLPEGIQFITSLTTLQIRHCDNLLLPEWLQHMTGDWFRIDGGSTSDSTAQAKKK